MHSHNDTLLTIWQQYRDELLQFAKRQQDPATAEDLMQELFLRLYAQPLLPTQPRAWLYRVLRNLLIDHERKPKALLSDNESLFEWESEENHSIYRQLEPCIPGLLSQLPASDRNVLNADLDGVPQATIAAQQGFSLSGTKSRIQRARRKLHQQLLQCCQFDFGNDGALQDFTPRTKKNCVFSAIAPSSLVNPVNKETTMKTITIHWRHLDVDGNTCDRCSDSGSEIRKAIDELNRDCAKSEIRFALREETLTAAQLADSNAVLIDGIQLEQLLNAESSNNCCESCGDLVGNKDAQCRTIERNGNSHEVVTAAFIREAACKVAPCCAPSQTACC